MKTIYLLTLLIFSATLLSDGVQPSGSGTQVDPYQVETLDNLLWISTNETCWNSYFIQTSDIDASETVNWNDGAGFSPIGLNDSISFIGNYNGQTHSISNLFIDRLYENTGFFGFINNCVIRNIELQNSNISGFLYVGILVGYSFDSELSNIEISGTINGNLMIGALIGKSISNDIEDCSSSATVYGGSSTGGLIGSNSNSEISNCYCNGNVTGTVHTGGFIGENYYTDITDCYCTGNVEGVSKVGGFIGEHYYGYITYCYCTGNVDGFDSTGGFAGMNRELTQILQCYSTGDVAGRNSIGGFIGINYGGEYTAVIENCFSTGEVEGNWYVGGLIGSSTISEIINCFSIGLVIGTQYITGGLVASSHDSTIENSFWDIETSGQTTSDGGTGKTTSEMQDVATYTSLSTVGLDDSWDFVGNPFDDTSNEDYWDINSNVNNGYPFLASLPPVGVEEKIICNSIESPQLLGNYPNPFNPSTTISFSIPDDSDVELNIYNIKGQKVNRLMSDQFSAGQYSIVWNGNADNGKSVSSGFYFYKLVVDGKFQSVKKCLLLK